MKPRPVAAEPGSCDYLPDFCAGRMVLAVVLIVEVTALTLTVARDNTLLGFWTDLARTSMFLLWLGLAGAALLCWLRPRLRHHSVAAGTTIALGAMTALVGVISELTWRLGNSGLVGPAEFGGLFPAQHASFVVRNMVIGCIVTALALRYYYITHEWRRNVELQAQARVHALQARIRPHFLFNSMNTIAALTRSNPARAEDAVQDLADLFRANLSDKRNQITLRDEIEVARIYQRIEQLRLGERLRVEWKLDALPGAAVVPSLMLQPLLENAIYHGIEPRPDGGTVSVNGELANGLITIVVRNPVPDGAIMREGNRLALANIRERLALVYGERATVKAGKFDEQYIVTLRFPLVTDQPVTA
ncbi:MAG: sensor histidine kinase [Steroidobacteraceae bacterium]